MQSIAITVITDNNDYAVAAAINAAVAELPPRTPSFVPVVVPVVIQDADHDLSIPVVASIVFDNAPDAFLDLCYYANQPGRPLTSAALRAQIP